MQHENMIFYRRRLPHYQPSGASFHLSFRLAGSLPRHKVVELMDAQEALLHQARSATDESQRKQQLEEAGDVYFRKFDDLLDKADEGPRWLQEPEIAAMVASAMSYRDGKQYELLVFCIMPNHVHLIIRVERSDTSLYRILQSLKAYTAREANRILGRSGDFWQHESYDHVVRDGAELERTIYYILNNPVKAGLCRKWNDWAWTYVREGLIDSWDETVSDV